MVDAIATGTAGQKTYVGIRAGWHNYGLSGITLDQARDPEWLIKAAGLDYNVVKCPTSFFLNGQNYVMDDKVAIVREDTRKHFGVQSDGYSVDVQPRDVITLLSDLLNEYDFKATFETLGAVDDGAKVWALIKTEDILIAGKDLLKPYIMAYNGYDGQTAYGAKSVITRIQCKNTFTTGLAEKRGQLDVRIKHTRNMAERMEATLKAFKLLSKQQHEAAQRLEILAQATATQGHVEELFALATPIPEGKDVTFDQLEDAKAKRLALWRVFQTSPAVERTTLYGAVNAVSEFIEHVEERRGQNANSTNKDWAFRRLDYMTNGLGQDRLGAVVTKAYSMAGVR